MTPELTYAAGAVLGLCAAVYAYFRYALTYWQRRKVPFEPPTVPFGNYAATVLGKRSMPQQAASLYFQNSEEPFIGTFFLGIPLLQLHDPDIIRQVLTKDFQDFNGRGIHFDPTYDPFSANLFAMSGPAWKNMRVKLSPTFSTGKIKYMFQTITDCSVFLAEHITESVKKNGGQYEEDMRELAARFSTDIISSVAFGVESNSMKNPNSEFRRMGQKTFEPCLDVSARQLLTFLGAGIMQFFRIRGFPADVDKFFTNMVSELVAYREANNVERADMLNLLIKLKNGGSVSPNGHGPEDKSKANGDDDRIKLTEKQIVGQVFVFFLAGFETTSTTTSFTLYELAKYPDIQEKVIAEIDAVLKKHGGKVDYDTIMDLPYTEMAIQETMRLYPPVPFLTREAMVKRQLPTTDVLLDKGTRLMIPVQALHTDPQYWPEPKKYDPLRFTEEAKKARHPMVYLPFGDGPRICIGMRLGLVQVKMALVTILSRCTVSLAPGMPFEARISPRCIVPAPIDGCRLILTARAK
ncbi:hypothetical protein ONE63_010204 [Megalurothrips usitatus]|uniref:Cytochrome P450 6a14 n=1 Tax=Megalurothrips usitatus TaxID=439358 RepID=A0AAV7XL94_9NEOP|nr:hypothetical protein ONE63_010204 [Megalurothrips usitatus]